MLPSSYRHKNSIVVYQPTTTELPKHLTYQDTVTSNQPWQKEQQIVTLLSPCKQNNQRVNHMTWQNHNNKMKQWQTQQTTAETNTPINKIRQKYCWHNSKMQQSQYKPSTMAKSPQKIKKRTPISRIVKLFLTQHSHPHASIVTLPSQSSRSMLPSTYSGPNVPVPTVPSTRSGHRYVTPTQPQNLYCCIKRGEQHKYKWTYTFSVELK